jgi:hypothetical protein
VVLRNIVVSSPTTLVQTAGQPVLPPPDLEKRDPARTSRAVLLYWVNESRASRKDSPLTMEANEIIKEPAFMMNII